MSRITQHICMFNLCLFDIRCSGKSLNLMTSGVLLHWLTLLKASAQLSSIIKGKINKLPNTPGNN